MKHWLALFILALVAGTLGWFGGRWLSERHAAHEISVQGAPRAGESDVVGNPGPDFVLPGLDGNVHRIGEWRGRVVLLNFWATWCKPCREEMPMLDELQSKLGGQGLQVVGVALDAPDAAQRFVERLGITYPILVNDTAGEDISLLYGDAQGVLPYSVLIGRDGTVEDTFAGRLERGALSQRVRSLL